MPEIQAFRGLRYDLGHVGSLSDVVAPPYDVISPQLQTDLYKKHPANVIRLILNRDEPGDDDPDIRYTRAARFLKNWRSEGVLAQEPDPAVYVYHQTFRHGDRELTRRGFMARVRLQRFGEGNIYPHEETHAAAKADRLKLTTQCRANLSQIFGLYPDQENRAQTILEKAIAGKTPLEATDHLGVVHHLWAVTDVKTISEVTAAMGGKPLFIADGHHRYETACTYRDQLAAQGSLEPNHPANFVLTMCVSISDPGMVVLPTHRLFRGLPLMTADELKCQLGDCFITEDGGGGGERAHGLWETLEVEGEQGTFGIFTARDRQWTLARITSQGRRRMAEVASDHSRDWQGLGVSILQRLVLENLLGTKKLPEPKYVHLVEELVESLLADERGAEPAFPVSVLVMPATIEHIQTISEHGERMPPKSTYFYPKLLSGLVINPLDGS